MKVVQKYSFEVEINGHVFNFNLPVSSNWDDAHQAALQILNQVSQMSYQARNPAPAPVAQAVVEPDEVANGGN